MTRFSTTTHINRCWSTADRGIALITTVCTDGHYDSPPKSYSESWTWFEVSEPDCFHHESGFREALTCLKHDYDAFVSAIDADMVTFAGTVTSGHHLGRLISNHQLWDDFPPIEPDHRVVSFSDGILRFCVYEPRKLDSSVDYTFRIVKYAFDVENLEILSRDVLVTV